MSFEPASYQVHGSEIATAFDKPTPLCSAAKGELHMEGASRPDTRLVDSGERTRPSDEALLAVIRWIFSLPRPDGRATASKNSSAAERSVGG